MDEVEMRREIKEAQYNLFDVINPILVALERKFGRPIKDLDFSRFQGGKGEEDRYSMVRATIKMEDVDWNLKI